MTLYAESSAVLSWLLGEANAEPVRHALAGAKIVVASVLTLVECDRVLLRAVGLGRIHEAIAADRHARLEAAAARWTILNVSPEVVERARQAFPVEPIRTLDALHLASALSARRSLPGLSVLSLDGRVRDAAERLGFRLLPVDGASAGSERP